MKTEYEPDDDGGIRVMAVAYEADPSLAPFACVMKSGGTELVDYCTLGNLMLCHRSNEGLCAEVRTPLPAPSLLGSLIIVWCSIAGEGSDC